MLNRFITTKAHVKFKFKLKCKLKLVTWKINSKQQEKKKIKSYIKWWQEIANEMKMGTYF